MKPLVTALCFGLFLTACQTTGERASKPDIDDAETALVFGNHERALAIFEELSAKGDSQADYFLGLMYEEGLGVSENLERAFSYYEKGALAGDADAQFALADLYASGKGTEEDLGMATKFFLRAAEQDMAAAQAVMGYFHQEGVGRKKNPSKAIAWYRKAAEQDSAYAQMKLGQMLVDAGAGQPAHAEGLMWLSRAQREAKNSKGFTYFDDAEDAYQSIADEARQTLAREAYNAGLDSRAGRGLPTSETHAAMWFLIAEFHGHRAAGRELRALGLAPLPRTESGALADKKYFSGGSRLSLGPSSLPTAERLALECIKANYRACG